MEDQGNGDHDLDDKGTVGSLHSEMPATRKRTRAAAASPDDHEDGPSASKRPRTAAAHRAATPGRSRNTPRPATSRNYAPVQAAVTVESDDNETNSLFDEDGGSGGVALFDLTKSDDGVPKELFQPVKDSSIKLSTFECVICMDSATNLTVTCCGMSIRACMALTACLHVLLNNHCRPHVLRPMPPPGHAYRTHQEGLSDVPPALRQADPEIQAPGKGLLPPRVEAQAIQEEWKTTGPALTCRTPTCIEAPAGKAEWWPRRGL